MTQLYLISPPQIENLPAFAKTLTEILEAAKGTVGSFQLRLKSDQKEPASGKLTLPPASRDSVLKAAELLIPICHQFEIPFILNDQPQIAKECGADGVHIGQEDGDMKATRIIVGEDAVIGVSCHDSRHLAMEAGEAGADYVAFGAFFPTTSKTEAAQKVWGVPTPDIIKDWVETTVVPCVAIGGITPQNCRPLVEAGADFLAVITCIWNHKESPTKAVSEFSSILGAK
ncbi:MAG: thiamine phosphate synthase [Rickettsiales bacterium]